MTTGSVEQNEMKINVATSANVINVTLIFYAHAVLEFLVASHDLPQQMLFSFWPLTWSQ